MWTASRTGAPETGGGECTPKKMILPAERMWEVYNALKIDKHASEDRGVALFVANGDVDSLCACMQLEVLPLLLLV